jgi:hypothetical protein
MREQAQSWLHNRLTKPLTGLTIKEPLNTSFWKTSRSLLIIIFYRPHTMFSAYIFCLPPFLGKILLLADGGLSPPSEEIS